MTENQILKKARSLSGRSRREKNIELLEEAVSTLRDGVKQYPNSPRLHFFLGNYCRELSRKILNEATVELRKAQKLQKNRKLQVKNLTELGLVEQWKHRFEASEKALNRALELDSTNKHTYTILATTYKLSGQYVKALNLLKTALAIDPKNNYFLKIEKDILDSTKAVMEANKIRKLISAAKTEEALEHFLQFFQEKQDHENLHHVIALKARLEKVNKEINRGTIRKQDSDLTIQQINVAILDLIKKI